MHLAFVLLESDTAPDVAAIVKAWPEFAPGQALTDAGKQDDVLQFDVPGLGQALVALMPMPVPDGEAQEAARFSLTAMSPDGPALLLHQAHLMVTVPDKLPLNFDNTTQFTRLLAAVVSATKAVGVYWGTASVSHPAEFFLDAARDPSMLPALWTGISIGREGDRLSLLSLGMSAFELPELLFSFPASLGNDGLFFFFDLLSYVIKRGEALPEGNTVGRDEHEKLKVRYAPSPIDESAQVWCVDLP